MRHARFSVAGAILALLVAGATSDAAEIKVYSTIGMRSVLEELKPKFEQASGHKLDITWGLAGALTKRVADGERPDASSPSGVASTVSSRREDRGAVSRNLGAVRRRRIGAQRGSEA